MNKPITTWMGGVFPHVRERDSNMELLRIVAMFLILMLHSNFFTIGEPSSNDMKYDTIVSLTRVFIKALSIIGVNVFVILSGWYGIRFKLDRLLGLFFQVLFFNIIGVVIAVVESRPINVFNVLGLDNTYWFINAYILLYILTPILNLFVEKSDKNVYRLFLVAFFVFQTLYGWFPCDTPWIYGGSSTISFIGLYMLMRYIKRFESDCIRWSWWKHLLVYLTMVSCMTLSVSVQIYFSIDPINRMFYYTSPFLIVASLAFVLLFSKMRFRSRLINWIAASSFAVYLFHMNYFVQPYYKGVLLYLFNTRSYWIYLLMSIGVCFVFYIVGTLCDKVRLVLWNRLIELSYYKKCVYNETEN